MMCTLNKNLGFFISTFEHYIRTSTKDYMGSMKGSFYANTL